MSDDQDQKRPFAASDKTFDLLLQEAKTDEPRVLPVYQRRFTWDTEAIDRLFDDADLLVTSTARPKPQHFAGAMVFSPQGDGKGKAIIDGQQRLTVVMLSLLAAAVRLGDTAFVDQVTTTTHPPRLIIKPDVKDIKQSRAVVAEVNQSGFLDEQIEAFGSDGTLRMGKYYKAYRHQLSRFEKLNARQVRRLIDALLNRFVIASINVRDPLWGATVFSSLNDTGVRLKDADLIRVFMYSKFGQSKKAAADAERFMKTEWAELEEHFDSEPDDLGDFYYHFASAAVDTNVTRGGLLQTLRKHWDAKDPSEIVDELESWMEPYKLVVGRELPPRQSDETGYFEALRRLQNTPNANTYWTYALQQVKAASENRRLRRRVAKCLRTLEAFIVRKALTESQVTGLRRPLLGLCAKGNSRGGVGSDINKLRSELRSLPPDLRGPSDDELRGVLTDLNSKFYKRSVTKYVLSVREICLAVPDRKSIRRAGTTDGIVSFATLESADVDHIYPQNPSHDWRLPGGELLGKPFDELVHCLGNLIILEHPLNRSRNSRYQGSLVTNYGASRLKDAEAVAALIRKRKKKPYWRPADMSRRAEQLADWMIKDDEGWPQPW